MIWINFCPMNGAHLGSHVGEMGDMRWQAPNEQSKSIQRTDKHWCLVGVCLPVAVTKHWLRQTWGEKGSFWLACCSPSLIETGQELEAGTQRTKQEPWCSLASLGLLTYLPYLAQTHLSRGGTAHSRLGPPISISLQKSAPRRCSRTSLTETILQLKFLFPKRL